MVNLIDARVKESRILIHVPFLTRLLLTVFAIFMTFTAKVLITGVQLLNEGEPLVYYLWVGFVTCSTVTTAIILIWAVLSPSPVIDCDNDGFSFRRMQHSSRIEWVNCSEINLAKEFVKGARIWGIDMIGPNLRGSECQLLFIAGGSKSRSAAIAADLERRREAAMALKGVKPRPDEDFWRRRARRWRVGLGVTGSVYVAVLIACEGQAVIRHRHALNAGNTDPYSSRPSWQPLSQLASNKTTKVLVATLDPALSCTDALGSAPGCTLVKVAYAFYSPTSKAVLLRQPGEPGCGPWKFSAFWIEGSSTQTVLPCGDEAWISAPNHKRPLADFIIAGVRVDTGSGISIQTQRWHETDRHWELQKVLKNIPEIQAHGS